MCVFLVAALFFLELGEGCQRSWASGKEDTNPVWGPSRFCVDSSFFAVTYDYAIKICHILLRLRHPTLPVSVVLLLGFSHPQNGHGMSGLSRPWDSINWPSFDQNELQFLGKPYRNQMPFAFLSHQSHYSDVCAQYRFVNYNCQLALFS